MARSLWIGTLLVALASAWLARGEPAGSPTPAANTGERLITVQEGDKPAQKCRVLKTWKTPEGNQALQVQAVDTGEMMTIIEEGPAVPTGSGLTGRVRTMTTRIFHWGPHKTPPPGVPMPPPTATVQSPPAAPGSGSPVAQAPMTGLVAPKPVVASSPRREWPSAHPGMAATVSARPDPVSQPAAAPAVQTVQATQVQTAQATQVIPAVPAPTAKPVTAATPPASKPAPPSAASATSPVVPPPAVGSSPMPCPVVIIEEPAKRERGLLSRLFRRNEPKLPIITGPPIVTSIQPVQPPTVVTPASPAPATKSTQSLPTTVVTPAAPAMTPTSPAKPASPATVMMPSRPTQAATAASPPRPPQTPPAVASASPAKPTVEPAQPKDWRQSWGKVETDDKTASPAKKTDTTSTSSTPKPATSSSPPRPLTAIKPETTRPVIPTTAATRADSTKAAPTRVPDLPRASTQKPDPLKEPGTYSRSPLPSASGTTTKPPITSVSKSGGSVVPTKMAAGTGKGDTTASSGHEHLPLGRGSVMAAGDVQFVPVPIVTMPNLTRMPQAPQPQVPQAPQPNQQVLLNAFSMAQGPPAPPKAGEMPNAFTPAIPVDESALGGGSAFSPPVPAYVGPMTGPMGPGMMPPHPAMMMARGMYPGAPVNPMMAGAMPAARPVPGAAPDVSQMLTTLRESVFPSQREWAADKLAACKWQTHPHVVEALVTALKDDPAATVRAACARSLAKMNANTVPVIGALQASKDDPDANVRREAEQALATLVPVRSPSAVQPAGGVMPTKP